MDQYEGGASPLSYEGGADTYLQVITSHTAALNNERADIEMMRHPLGVKRGPDQSVGRRIKHDATTLILCCKIGVS
jgi:hypothetical protein